MSVRMRIFGAAQCTNLVATSEWLVNVMSVTTGVTIHHSGIVRPIAEYTLFDGFFPQTYNAQMDGCPRTAGPRANKILYL